MCGRVTLFTPAQVEYLRNYERLQDKTYERKFPVKYPPGTASESFSWLSRLPLAPVLYARQPRGEYLLLSVCCHCCHVLAPW